MPDLIHRFIFDDFDIRGEIISLEQSYQTALRNGDYPDPAGYLLGEFMAAAGLLSAVLKFDGTLTLQARGNGPLPLIMADCTRHHSLRAIAQLSEAAIPTEVSLKQLLGVGTLAITIDPASGERYQGIVALEHDRLDRCLESYFEQSEQLPTRLWLCADGERAGGLLLQALPGQKNADSDARQEYWQHITQLAGTITAAEQLSLSHQEQLHRLFHQEKLRLFAPENLAFNCSCSRDRTSVALQTMGEQEIRDILDEQGIIEIDCQFCHQTYRYSADDIEQLFNPAAPPLH